MNEKLLRGVIRTMLDEMYKRPRKIDSAPWATRLSRSKPDTQDRQKLIDNMMFAISNDTDSALAAVFPMVCRFAGVSDKIMREFKRTSDAWYAWVDEHKQSVKNLPPRDWPKGGLELRSEAGEFNMQVRQLLWSADLKGFDEMLKTWAQGASSGEIDWRPNETIPEDYYAL